MLFHFGLSLISLYLYVRDVTFLRPVEMSSADNIHRKFDVHLCTFLALLVMRYAPYQATAFHLHFHLHQSPSPPTTIINIHTHSHTNTQTTFWLSENCILYCAKGILLRYNAIHCKAIGLPYKSLNGNCYRVFGCEYLYTYIERELDIERESRI